MPSRLYFKCFGRAQRSSPTNTQTNPNLSLKKQTSFALALFSCFCRACLFYFYLINPPLKLLCFLQPLFYRFYSLKVEINSEFLIPNSESVLQILTAAALILFAASAGAEGVFAYDPFALYGLGLVACRGFLGDLFPLNLLVAANADREHQL